MTTTAGDLELRIGKLRSGPAYSPSLLEPRRRGRPDIVRGAHGRSTLHGACPPAKVYDLVKALGPDPGIFKFEVSRICGDLNVEGVRLRRRWPRPATGMCFSTPPAARQGWTGSGVPAVVVAIGVSADGRWEVLGLDVVDSEDGAFGPPFSAR
ncbi:MAG: transposase [Nocardioidaceae bacterium]